jgi:hypothetical protein
MKGKEHTVCVYTSWLVVPSANIEGYIAGENEQNVAYHAREDDHTVHIFRNQGGSL